MWGSVWPRFKRAADRLFHDGELVLVGVSGGPDSVCLAHALRLYSQRRPLRLRLAHVDHRLRPGSARDARFVEALGRRWGLPVDVATVEVSAARGVEDGARRARYQALAALAKRRGATAVAVGHQMDDQAETVLLHLLRGTDPKGLAAMPESRPLYKGSRVRLVRPLLGLRRGEIEAYLRAHGATWRTDKTNRSERFTRNWLRRRVLPLLETRNPKIREHLATLASKLQRKR